MCVGGRIIEIADGFVNQANLKRVVRIWVMDRNGDECCVYAEEAAVMPLLGDQVWWQSNKVYFMGDTAFLKKVGASFAPTCRERMGA